MKLEVEIHEGSDTVDSTVNIKTLERFPYIVKSPLMKNGKQYNVGETIMLDAVTAENFRNAGDI